MSRREDDVADHDEAGGGADRLPAVRPSVAPAPVDRTAELARAVGSPLAVPMLALAMMQATASAMTEAMAAMMRPWLIGVPITPSAARDWPGPGVHVSYTHLEMHWPTR
jgi:hypothetical protein